MSNYPPGVTGNEPQIAGYPEREVDVECGQPNPSIYTTDEYGNNPEQVWLDTCPYEGTAIAQGDLFGGWWWTCPLCRTDHQITD